MHFNGKYLVVFNFDIGAHHWIHKFIYCDVPFRCDIIQLLPLSEGDMTICSPSTGYIALGRSDMPHYNGMLLHVQLHI